MLSKSFWSEVIGGYAPKLVDLFRNVSKTCRGVWQAPV